MGAKLQERSRFLASKMALVFIAIIVLELVLIGHQVQPLKSIKKKLLFKKLKKILPLLALIKKPKKKLILIPIPIPMFNKPMDSMPMMDSMMDMPMNYQQESHTSGGSGAGGYSQESNQDKGNGGGY